MEFTFTILGEPRTKKNHTQIVGSGARCPRCGKPQKQWVSQGTAYKRFAAEAAQQLRPKPETPIDRPVAVRYEIFMGTRRKVDDLNLFAALDDILVSAGILADDNVRIIRSRDGSRVLYDKGNPRTEITISDAEGDGK